MVQDMRLEAQIAYLRWLSLEEAAEEQLVRTLRDYAAGAHPVYLTERQKQFIGLKASTTARLYSHNLCQLVIDAVVERLSVVGFAPSLAEDEERFSSLERWLDVWWENNRTEALQDEVHEAALRDGAAYLVVDWDSEEGRPRWTLNLKSDGTQGIKVHRDPNNGRVIFAAKKWQVYDPINTENNGRTRYTLYFPDRVEKYISTRDSSAGIGGTIWEPYRDSEDEPWPIPWVDDEGKPLGVAAVEFANPGGSEIAGMLPLQDMLNKSDLDLIAATDASGFRILFASGVTTSVDPTTGQTESLTIRPGTLLRFPSQDAKLGVIEPIDPRLLIASCKYWIESIAGVTRTPQYLFQAIGADQPSGESLRQQEVGLVRKVQRRQQVFGNAWEDVIYMSAKLHNLYRPGEAVEVVRLQTEWAKAEEFVDEIEQQRRQAETALMWQQVGVSQETTLTRLGFDPELEAERRQVGSAQMGESLLQAFERGE